MGVVRMIFEVCITALLVPIVLLLRIVKSVYKLRYGYFIVDRIGHFAFDVGYYLSECEYSGRKKGKDIFFFEGITPNTYFLELCRRKIFFAPFVRYLYRANCVLPYGSDQKLLPARRTTASRDRSGLLGITGPAFSFTETENEKGQEYLRYLGYPNEKYVCLIVRDSAYLRQLRPDRDWSYHDYRDTNIKSYEKSAKALADRGYLVFRMGKAVQQPFEIDHPKIIDYAMSPRKSDFLDVWLMANCRFCISTGTGLDEIATVFRRPVVYVNYLPVLDVISYVPSISVFKRLDWADSGNPLTLSDHLRHTYFNSEQYSADRIQITDLEGEEILDAVIEMEERLTSAWMPSEIADELQARFWEILRMSPAFNKYHGRIHPDARIGARFLEKDHHWFLK